MIAWLAPPKILKLSSTRVDVWRVFTAMEVEPVSSFESTLSSDERQRASRFHFDQDRSRYIMTHVSLRDILARYLQTEPRQLKLSVNEFGKPFLLEHKIEFNLTHSGDYALIAVTCRRKIGVDVEQVRADVEIESIAGRYFSTQEVSELMTLPLQQQPIGFFNCWTRKEAIIKAHGLGLSLPLDSFDVSLKPGEPAILRATRPDANEAAHWTMLALDVDANYAGAVAVQGKSIDFRFWNYES